jgi:flagellar protein FliL
MAKKAKDESAEGDNPAAEAPKGGKKKLIIIIAAVVLLLGGGGGGYFFFMKGKAGAEAEKVVVKKPVSFVDVRELLVNLATEPNQERQRFLKIKVALEIGDPKTVPNIQPLLPRIEDTFQVFMRELRASDLEGSAGTFRLREELLRRVNIAVYPAKVDALLFKDIVVQ